MSKMKVLIPFSVILVILFSVSGIAYAAGFTDCAGRADEKLISECYEKGLILGAKEGSFQPDRFITRAQFVTIANRAFKLEKTTEINFTDVKKGVWYEAEVAKAAAAGYIDTSSDSFNPNGMVTMPDAAKMLGILNKDDKAVDLSQTNRKLNRAEALALIYNASGGNAEAFLPGNLPEGLVDAVTIDGKSITLTGILIDEHCFAFKDPANDTKMCLMMVNCKASGYGAAVLKSDGSYEFYAFDDAGQVLAADIIKNTKKMKNIIIEVKGSLDGEIVKVSSIVEK